MLLFSKLPASLSCVHKNLFVFLSNLFSLKRKWWKSSKLLLLLIWNGKQKIVTFQLLGYMKNKLSIFYIMINKLEFILHLIVWLCCLACIIEWEFMLHGCWKVEANWTILHNDSNTFGYYKWCLSSLHYNSQTMLL